MNIKKLLIILAIILIAFCVKIFFFDGVNFFSKNIILWTDNPEFISYIEMFNSQHSIKIETIYKENPAIELLKTKKYPDIIIGSYLNSPQIAGNFTKLNHLFRNDKISKSSFYKPLLEKGTKESQQIVLPVSFNMPALMFGRGNVSDSISAIYLNYKNIAELSKAFNKTSSAESKVNKNKLAFSPRWNSDMLYYHAVMNNADFQLADNKKIIYNSDSIQRSLEDARAFIENINNGIKRDKIFEEKHLYKLPEDLIREQRIFFAYTDMRDFYAMGAQKRGLLNFRWLSHNDKIPVCDDIIYAGIPKHCSNRKGAEIFMIWFFNYSTQEAIMEAGITKKIKSFGIANGFSSIRSINEQVFPKYYPQLVSHIPPNDMLMFPLALPIEWEYVKNTVIKKWLYTEAGNEKTTSILDTAISDWYKTHPGF